MARRVLSFWVLCWGGLVGVWQAGRGRSSAVGGFSLPELLAVLALIGIVLAIGIPLVSEQVRMAEIRGIADELALNLRAARMLSVTQHTPIAFKIFVDPDNYCLYEAPDGRFPRTFKMRGAVKISPDSDRRIDFKSNGSVDVARAIVLEAAISGGRERWTADVNTMGMVKLARERVN